MGFWPVTKRVIKDSDIVLLILDVRMPELSRNKELERMIAFHHKKLIHVFNKVDIVSSKYLAFVKERYPDAYYVSGVKNININNLKRQLLIDAKAMKIKTPRIGVVGYPNVGKSAIINALAKRARAKVASRAGTTKGIQWIKAGSLLVLDSPGVVPFEDHELMLGVMGAKNVEKIKTIERVAYFIIKMLMQYDPKVLENCYDLSFEKKDQSVILEEVGKKKGFLLKGGIVDERRAALLIIKDWQHGKLKF